MRKFERILWMVMVLAIALPSLAQDERERPNKAREQIGLTRNPDAVRERVTSREDVSDESLDAGAKDRIKRVAKSLKKRFLDQWKRYDDLKKKIDDEKKKPRGDRDRTKLKKWEDELDKVKEENKDLKKKYDMTSDEVKKETQKQVKEEKVKEAQEEENKKAKQEGRKPKEIDDVDMPHGSPPILH
jgi:hypothetical protein